ncbi:MAG: SGNH/GDSL hydrolase family protein [Phycisphaerae bacterium]
MPPDSAPLSFTRDDRLLFIGDSITDCGRNNDPEHLGQGYVRLVRDALLARDPAAAPQIINRGTNGHRVPDLAERWDRDVIAADPTVVSIKIGINDVWRQLDTPGLGVPIEDYTATYAGLLERTRTALPGAKLVLCEPSVIWPRASPTPTRGNELLQPYVHAVRALGEQFGVAAVVGLHGAFVSARSARPEVDWAPDGVHPSPVGHMLIAHTWLKAVLGQVDG